MPKPSPLYARYLALLVTLALLISYWTPATAATQQTFIPIGSGYVSDTLQRFAQAAASHDTNGNIYMLLVPITFSPDAFTISNHERKSNLSLAAERRAMLQSACELVKAAQQTCQAVLVPMLVRDDAFLQSNLDLFTADLDGIFIPGGDQTIAMQVVAETPTEQRMAAAFATGVVLGGNSAGAAVQSLHMIGGYTGNNGPENGFEQGAVDLWLGQPSAHRGLVFGLRNTVLDQHVLQRGRVARLINTTWTSGLLGIGVDAETAAPIMNEQTLTDVVGRSAAFVVDTRTYAAQGRYAGPTNSLAISRVATHVIPQGGYGYDLVARQPLVNGLAQATPDISGRSFAALQLPAGSGPLLLGGDISGDKAGLAAARFVTLSGGANARIVVLTLGYAKSSLARADAKDYAAAFATLGVSAPVQWFVLDKRADQAAIQSAIQQATGVFITAPDQSVVMDALSTTQPLITSIHSRWLAGMTLMLDNAATAAAGQHIVANPAPPSDSAALEDFGIASFRPDSVTIRDGLGFVPGLSFGPRLVVERRWGWMYNLLYANPQVPVLGIDVGTLLELNQTAATIHGLRTAVMFDGRQGSYSLGSNGSLGARYVVLDSFVNGDALIP